MKYQCLNKDLDTRGNDFKKNRIYMLLSFNILILSDKNINR